jgi:hypothetical protein
MRNAHVMALAAICLFLGGTKAPASPSARKASGQARPAAAPAAASRSAQDRQPGSPSSDGLIFPDPAQEIWIVKQIPGGGDLPLGRRLPESDPLAAKIMAELRLPFHHSVIRLSQCSRNLAQRQPGPNVLFLSGNEGGFPRHGLAVQEGKEVREYPDLNYVDLVLDEDRLAGGGLSIYSHELGHVMMMNVGPGLPETRSVKQHVSMGVTDESTAFNEGWGEHFQRLAYDAVPAYARAFVDGFDYRRGVRGLWHSNVDEELRLNGVVENLYIWQKALPVDDPSRFSPEELVLLEHTSPLFDRTRLKNGRQMLACEGVLATLFFRIDTSPVIQNNYAAAPFYEPFLLAPFPRSGKPQDIFTPFENALLKNLWVWSLMKRRLAAGPEKPPLLVFLEEWGRAFPQDRDELLRIFLATTAGRTASTEPGRLLETASLAGIVGDYARFMPAASNYAKSLADLTAKAISGATELGAALPRDLGREQGSLDPHDALEPREQEASQDRPQHLFGLGPDDVSGGHRQPGARDHRGPRPGGRLQEPRGGRARGVFRRIEVGERQSERAAARGRRARLQ